MTAQRQHTSAEREPLRRRQVGRCWHCNQILHDGDQHCGQCSAPQWMRPVTGTMAEIRDRPRDSTTAAGIVIIATFLLVPFWFWASIGTMAVISPPEVTTTTFTNATVVEGSILGTARVLWSVVFAIGLTWATWALAYNVVRKAENTA